MTAPIVGQVAVEVLSDARALAKSLRKEVEAAFRDLDVGKLVRESLRNQKIKLPVEPDLDTDGIGEKVRRTRIPKIPVQVDPLLSAFQSEVRRQTNALAKTVNAKIPVGADTAGLRAELGAELAAVQSHLKLQVPTEPGAKAEYEAKLKALVDAASASVKANIKVDPDTKDLSALAGIVGRLAPNFGGISTTITGIGSAVQGLADGVAKFATQAAAGGSQLAGSVAAAAGPVGAIAALLATAAAAMGGLAAAAVLAVPTLTAAAGAAAAIPAALAGLGAIVGTLTLGFKGISEAFKPKTGGGGAAGSVANQARQIAAASRQVEAARRGIASANRGLDNAERSLSQAEDNLVKAQQRARAAQAAVSQARKDAVGDIVKLNRELQGAKISEGEAAQAVDDALLALNEAKLTGNIPDINRADLAYQRAVLTLEDAKDASKDLQTQVDATNKSGADGTDRVKQALQEQASAADDVKQSQEGLRDAQDGLLAAQDSLKSATDGLKSAQDGLAAAQEKTAAGSAAAAAKLIPLAPAAQRFVDAVKALKPAFEGLRLDVQQRLFAGLDQTVTRLGEAWIPALKTTLGRYADTFNGFFRNLGTSISTPTFIADLQAGAEGARQGLSSIGDAVTAKLVPAFGALSRAAGPFMAALGKEIADLVTEFGDWVLQGEKTGGLKTFFDKAVTALHEIFTTGKLVGAIIGDLFSIITGAQQSSGQTPLDSFNNALKKIDTFLKDPQHQQQIRDLITDLTGALVSFGRLAATIDGFFDKLPGDTKSGSAGSAIGKALVAGLVAGVVEAMKLSLELMLLPFRPIIDGVKELFGIHSPSTVFAEIGRNIVLGLIQGIGSVLATLGSYAQNLRIAVVNAVASAGSWLINAGRNAVIGLGNGIVSLFGNLSSRAAGLRTTISNALSNAANLLYNAGRNVVVGLINGIGSLIGTLGSYLGDIGAFIQQHKGPPSADKVLLYDAGRLIMGGLITGIGDQKETLAAQLADVTSLVADTALPGFGVQADAAISASLQASSQQQLVASWKTGATGDQVLDAFARLIDLRYRGDVQAAFSRTG